MPGNLYGDYENLLLKLLNFVREKEKVTLDQLLKWAADNAIGSFTLSLLIEDLEKRGDIKCSKERRKIKAFIGDVKLPEYIYCTHASTIVEEKIVKKKSKSLSELSQAKTLAKKPQKLEIERRTPAKLIEKQKKEEKRKSLRKKSSKTSISLLDFFVQEAEKEVSLVEEAKEEAKEKIATEEELQVSAKTIGETETREEEEEEERTRDRYRDAVLTGSLSAFMLSQKEKEGSTAESSLEDDLAKAIEYLNTYWSVGEIRFELDMMALGIKDPKKILKKLIDLGYVVKHDLGVINATEKLPKVKKKETFFELLSS